MVNETAIYIIEQASVMQWECKMFNWVAHVRMLILEIAHFYSSLHKHFMEKCVFSAFRFKISMFYVLFKKIITIYFKLCYFCKNK